MHANSPRYSGKFACKFQQVVTVNRTATHGTNCSPKCILVKPINYKSLKILPSKSYLSL